jgi:hypothetical protein
MCTLQTKIRNTYVRCNPAPDTHAPSLVGEAPRWLYLATAASVVAYVNLDCMDGKQARRTGSSSPLGQLFDHGGLWQAHLGARAPERLLLILMIPCGCGCCCWLLAALLPTA